MENWRHIACWADYAVIFRGLTRKRAYRLTPERRRRLKAVLGDAIEPAEAGQGWLWTWHDWNWHNIGGK